MLLLHSTTPLIYYIVSVLAQWCVQLSDRPDSSSSGPSVPPLVLSLCICAVKRFIASRTTGDWWAHTSSSDPHPPPCSKTQTAKGKRRSTAPPSMQAASCTGDSAAMECTLGLSEEDWAAIVPCSYALVVASAGSAASLSAHFTSGLKDMVRSLNLSMHSSPQRLQVALLLLAYAQLNKQLLAGGHRNLWVVKAPEASKGLNIRVFYRLGDILECEKGMSGRTVQKYVERPLMVQTVSATTHQKHAHAARNFFQWHQGPPARELTTSWVKFDLRVWVLVTNFESEGSVRAYIYNRTYGRRCGQCYNYDVSSIGKPYTHLTNYSIQKHRGGTGTVVTTASNSAENEGEDNNMSPRIADGGTNVSRLRSTVSAIRTKSTSLLSQKGVADESSEKLESDRATDLLVTHEQIMEVLSGACRHKSAAGTTLPFNSGDEAWHRHIWPRIRHKTSCLLELAAQSVQHRDKSFEFLGFDVIVDEAFEPWVLEVNMSPALAHRNEQHDAMIATMADQMVGIVLRDCGLDDCSTGQPTANSEKNLGSWESLATSRIGDDKSSIDYHCSCPKDKVLSPHCGVLRREEILLRDYYGYRREGDDPVTRRQKKVHYPRRAVRNLFASLYRSSSTLTTADDESSGGMHEGESAGRGRLGCNMWRTPARPRSASATRRRPTSAGATGRTAGSRNSNPCAPNPLNLPFTAHFDVNFAVVGKEIVREKILFSDGCCEAFNAVLLLQRYMVT